MQGSKIWGAVVLAGLVGAVSTAGCSCGDSNTGSGGGHASTGSNMGGGGSSSEGDGKITSSTLVADQLAFDATLSDDGSVVYFTGMSPQGDGAVYTVPASGGTANVVTKTGLIAPFGIALSTDQKTLYVADPGAATSKEDGGSIFTVKAEGGTASALMGSAGAIPRSLEVSGGFVFFTGTVKGAPGVYKISDAGGAITEVASGASFHDPAGLAVASDGTVYVLDTIGGSRHDATVLAIAKGGKVSTLLPHAEVGYPAGVAIAQDEKAVLVSGLRDALDHSAVLRVDVTSHEVTYFPADGKKSDFTALFEPGGLHRARNKDVYAWVVADTMGGGVFVLK
jgi:hypothetical protein